MQKGSSWAAVVANKGQVLSLNILITPAISLKITWVKSEYIHIQQLWVKCQVLAVGSEIYIALYRFHVDSHEDFIDFILLK